MLLNHIHPLVLKKHSICWYGKKYKILIRNEEFTKQEALKAEKHLNAVLPIVLQCTNQQQATAEYKERIRVLRKNKMCLM